MQVHNGIHKAWQATGLEGVRNASRLTEQLAKAHAFSHVEAQPGMHGEEMVIDSPTTHNHYQAPPPASPWPWVALAITAMLLAGVLGAAFLLRPSPQPQRTTSAPGTPADLYSIRIYEP